MPDNIIHHYHHQERGAEGGGRGLTIVSSTRSVALFSAFPEDTMNSLIKKAEGILSKENNK